MGRGRDRALKAHADQIDAGELAPDAIARPRPSNQVDRPQPQRGAATIFQKNFNENKKRTCHREQTMHKWSHTAAVAVSPLIVQKEERP
jgi:hypothetical protein